MPQTPADLWFLQNQRRLLGIVNTDLGRDLLSIPRQHPFIGKITPNALHCLLSIKNNQATILADVRGCPSWANMIRKRWDVFSSYARYFDANEGNLALPVSPAARSKRAVFAATLTAFPAAGANSPCDGPTNEVSQNVTFATLRGSAGNQGGLETTTLDRHAGLDASVTTNQFADMRRAHYMFDTSSITSAATISAGDFFIYGNFKTNGLGACDIYVCQSTVTSNSALAASDFASVGSTSFGTITYASWNAAAYNDFSLNASGIANISKTGISKFATRLDWDINNSFGGVWASLASTRYESYFADIGNPTQEPKLVVVYTTTSVDSSWYMQLNQQFAPRVFSVGY